MSENDCKVVVEEIYRDYEPSVPVKKTIERLLSIVPPERLIGLQAIQLTNVNALNRQNKRQKTLSRKRKVSLKDCGGWYQPKWNRQPAYIVILVDNLIETCPSWVLRFKFIQALILSETMYHEIGHHIHATQVPEYKEREDVANNWARKLERSYLWKKHWYVMIIFYPLKPIFRLAGRYIEKIRIALL